METREIFVVDKTNFLKEKDSFMSEDFQFNKINWSQDIVDRFWNKVRFPENIDDCWEWAAFRDDEGYGRFSINCKMFFAHRLSWAFYSGLIEDELLVLHKCDNPACVNPNHLFLGTQADNMRDRNNKNRQAKGSRNGKSILTEEIIHEMLDGIVLGEYRSVNDICQKFNINHYAVYDILRGRIWRDCTVKNYTDQQMEQIRSKIYVNPKNLMNHLSKLDKSSVEQIKEMLQQNICVRVIAKQFNLAESTIYRIRNGKTWSHVTGWRQCVS